MTDSARGVVADAARSGARSRHGSLNTPPPRGTGPCATCLDLGVRLELALSTLWWSAGLVRRGGYTRRVDSGVVTRGGTRGWLLCGWIVHGVVRIEGDSQG